MKVLILQANPNLKSFCSRVAKHYKQSAKEAGHIVRYTNIVNLDYNYNLHPNMEFEDDLKQQQADIKWADHVVIVSPVWWMGFPAGLKAYIDRVFVSGFAFDFPNSNPILGKFLPEPLLKGKTLRLISTQDSPRFALWLMGNTFNLAFRYGLFQYVGFKYRRSVFAKMRLADESKRRNWLDKVSELAKEAK